MLAGCMLMSMPPLVWHACASMQPHACAFPPHADTYGQQSCGHSWTRNIQDRRLFSRRGSCEHLPGGDRGWMVGAKVRTCVRAACAGLVSKSGAAGTCTVAQLGLLSFGGSHLGLLSSGGSQLGLLSFGGPRHAVLRAELRFASVTPNLGVRAIMRNHAEHSHEAPAPLVLATVPAAILCRRHALVAYSIKDITPHVYTHHNMLSHN